MVFNKDCVICASKVYLEFLRLGGGISIPFECEHVENTKLFQIRSRFQQIISISLSVLFCTMPLYEISSYIIRGGNTTNETIKHITDFLFKIKTSIIFLIIFSKNKLRIREIRAMQELNETGMKNGITSASGNKALFGITSEFRIRSELGVAGELGVRKEFEVRKEFGIRNEFDVTNEFGIGSEFRMNSINQFRNKNMVGKQSEINAKFESISLTRTKNQPVKLLETKNRSSFNIQSSINTQLRINTQTRINTQSGTIKTNPEVNRKLTNTYQIPVSSNVNTLNLRGSTYVLSRQNLKDIKKQSQQYVFMNLFFLAIFAANIFYVHKPTSLYKIYMILSQIFCLYFDLTNMATCWYTYKMYSLFLDKFGEELKYALMERIVESNVTLESSIIHISRFYMAILKNFQLTKQGVQDITVTWVLLGVTFLVLSLYLMVEGIERDGTNMFSYYNFITEANTYWTMTVGPTIAIWFQKIINKVS